MYVLKLNQNVKFVTPVFGTRAISQIYIYVLHVFIKNTHSVLSIFNPVYALRFKKKLIFGFNSNLSILSVPDEGYSRNVLCAVNLVLTYVFIHTRQRDMKVAHDQGRNYY